MDNALGVYEYINLLGLQAKEPLRLDDLKTLVYKRGGVDGNLCTHRPIGVRQSLLNGDLVELLGGCAQEGTTACGDYHPAWCRHLARQTLEDCRVLGVDGENGYIALRSFPHNVLTSHHKALLVGKSQALGGFDRRKRRQHTRIAHKGIDYRINLATRNNLRERLVARIDLYRLVCESLLNSRIVFGIGDNHTVGLELNGLLHKSLPARARCEGCNLKLFGSAAYNVERLSAY